MLLNEIEIPNSNATKDPEIQSIHKVVNIQKLAKSVDQYVSKYSREMPDLTKVILDSYLPMFRDSVSSTLSKSAKTSIKNKLKYLAVPDFVETKHPKDQAVEFKQTFDSIYDAIDNKTRDIDTLKTVIDGEFDKMIAVADGWKGWIAEHFLK